MMKPHHRTTTILAVFALAAALFAGGCGFFGGGANNQFSGNAGGSWGKPERPRFKIPVTAVQLERGRMFSYLQAVGTVAPVKEIELKPEMTGRIYYTRRWLEGDEVKEGDVLAAMDDRELRLNINEAELQLEIAKAAVKPASAQLAQAYKDEQFRETMYKRGAMSKAEFDQSVLTRIQRENQYEETLKNIESREMALAKLKQELEKVQIAIPFDGVLLPAEQSVNTGGQEGSVTDLTIRNGQMVGESTILCRLADIDQVYVALDVPAKDLAEIQVGQDVELEVYTKAGDRFRGTVHDISTALNAGTRTYTVNVLVDNTDHLLRPGMFAKAQIITREKLDALSIPREIIQIRNNREVVFVAKEKPAPEEGGGTVPEPNPVASAGGADAGSVAFAAETDPEPGSSLEEVPEEEAVLEMVAEEREIVRGIENRERVEILDGLREGEYLIILGYETLTDGIDVNVTILEEEEPDSLLSSR